MIDPDVQKTPGDIGKTLGQEPQLLEALQNDYSLKSTGRPSPALVEMYTDAMRRRWESAKQNYSDTSKYWEKQGAQMKATPGFMNLPGIGEVDKRWPSAPAKESGDDSSFVPKAVAGSKQKQPPHGHRTVTQGGVKYTWNPNTGQYE
jgi:hypothetical protein